MTVHRIRLRGFWTGTPLADGRVSHRRAFGRPRTLGPGERAWLVCEDAPGSGVAYLNGKPAWLCEGGRVEFDVTDRLGPRNEVAFDLPAGRGLGEVALEIRPASPG